MDSIDRLGDDFKDFKEEALDWTFESVFGGGN
jgi:hypothetical protein